MPVASAYRVVIPAAGAGLRMGTPAPKQYLPIGDRTIIEYTLDAVLACARVDSVVVAVAPDDAVWSGIEARYAGKPVTSVAGGDERCHSVLNALDHLAQSGRPEDWVLVHDAARPCVRPADIDALIDTLGATETGGLLGVPVADTMKQVGQDGRVEQTVTRDGLWHALTPQMFRLGMLRSALRSALAEGRLVTDEASAMELAGHQPRMVQGRRDNIKITLPADLELAAFYLQARDAK